MITAVTTAAVASWRRKAGDKVVFVPTMGALHAGHAALIRRARRLAGKEGSVAVSIFVNPTQFGPKEDFSRYPRPHRADAALCRNEGVDLLFRPDVREMYAPDASVSVCEKQLFLRFEGAERPGHFDGVCTVVAMLFQIIRPDIAVFGEKDWQQLAVIRRMVRDLKFPVRITGHPVVREEDGLALSSRNRFLSPDARSVAPRIFQALTAAAMEAEAGAKAPAVEKQLRRDLGAIPGASVDYASIVEETTLGALGRITPVTKARALVAVRLGGVRLLDNLAIPLAR
jgi:pantoate--beta-alanine ligase